MNSIIIYKKDSADAIASAAIVYHGVRLINTPNEKKTCIAETQENIIFSLQQIVNEYLKSGLFMSGRLYIIGFELTSEFIKTIAELHSKISVLNSCVIFMSYIKDDYKNRIKKIRTECNLEGIIGSPEIMHYYNDKIILYVSNSRSITWSCYRMTYDLNRRKPIPIRYIEDYTVNKNNQYKLDDTKYFIEYILLYCGDPALPIWKDILEGCIPKERKPELRSFNEKWFNMIENFIKDGKMYYFQKYIIRKYW